MISTTSEEHKAAPALATSDHRYDPREIYRSIFGEKMRGRGQKWPHIDVAEMRAVNPDFVGWIYMPLSPLNYPVVKDRRDNYYLTHNFSGEPSIHGAISLDVRLGGRLSAYSTFFYGHHMKDWSMFQSIVELANPPFLKEHPSIYLLMEGRYFEARIFAGVCYWSREAKKLAERARFRSRGDYAGWLSEIRANSVIDADVPVTPEDRVAGFCTCAYPAEKTFDQFAAYGVLREIEPTACFGPGR